MERRVWTVIPSVDEPLYPNLYVILVGEPGVGKTFPIKIARRMLKKTEVIVSATSFTGASLADDLNEAKRRIVRMTSTPPYIEYNSLQIIALEFSTMLPGWDATIINKFTDLYDCGPFEETRRYKKTDPIRIQDTQLSILAATTPSFLNELLPVGAWDQGFISRVFLIFSGMIEKRSIKEPRVKNPKLEETLTDELKIVTSAFGFMKWEDEALDAIDRWQLAGSPPEVDHPRLRHYASRRIAHLTKLCMVASMSRADNQMRITFEDYQTALDWLVEAEFFMPDIFKAMVTGGDSAAIEETFHFVFTQWTTKKKGVPEHLITQFLMQRVPNHSVVRILELMQRSNMIVAEGVEHGRAVYKPIAKQSHRQ